MSKTKPESNYLCLSLCTFCSLQEKKRMDSHETNLTGEDEVVITKTIRSVSGTKLQFQSLCIHVEISIRPYN